MKESESRKPFRIISDLREEDRPRWRIRTEDGQVRGPLSDHGLKALAEVGILTEISEVWVDESGKFISICDHPIWPKIRVSKSELMLKQRLGLRDSRPPIRHVPPSRSSQVPFVSRSASTPPFGSSHSFAVPSCEGVPAPASVSDESAFWSVRATYPSTKDNHRQVSSRAQEHRRRLEAQHLAKMSGIFGALRVADALRGLRELFVLGLFLALGDFVRRGFVETLGAARWLGVFGVGVLALAYYILAAFQD